MWRDGKNKIRHLRQFLRGWAKHQSGIYKVEKERLTRIINELDVKAESILLREILRMRLRRVASPYERGGDEMGA